MDIEIDYASEIYGADMPRCLVRIDDMDDPVELIGPDKRKVSVADRRSDDEPTRIVISVFFDKQRPVQALARVVEPRAIKLRLVEPFRMTGTVIAESKPRYSLAAAAVDDGCDIVCLPPTRQRSGPGRCVVCEGKSGVFEFCC